jgi:hypothetical protein
LPTDPLTGARYPASSASPAVYQDIQNAVNDLSDVIGGNYTTNSARDTAFAAWVAQGNTMTNGLQCRVAGFPQVYRSSAWHGVSPIIYTSTTVDTTSYTADHAVMTLSIPDPLFPFVIQAEGSVLASVGAGVTLIPVIQRGGTDVPPNGPNTVNGTGGTLTGLLLSTMVPAVTGTLTGAQTITLMIHKSGTAGNGFNCSQDGYARLVATVYPV